AGAAGQDQVARAATIRRTEFVTPLTTGRKHSETIATRTRRASGHNRSTARRPGDGARIVCRTLDRLRRRSMDAPESFVAAPEELTSRPQKAHENDRISGTQSPSDPTHLNTTQGVCRD